MKNLVVIAAILAIWLLASAPAESFRPAGNWFGYPGTTPGTVGYQARGDWNGVQPATTVVDPQIPLP